MGILRWWQRATLSLGALALVPAIAYGGLLLSRPPRAPLVQQPFSGIEYRRQVRHAPRPLVVHVAEIDLQAPGIEVITTPPENPRSARLISSRSRAYPFKAQTTSEFLRATGTQLAINGSFFFPFHAETPWDYYPHSGEPVAIVGQSIFNGAPVSPPKRNWGVLCIGSERRATIARSACPPATRHALAGRDVLLADSEPLIDLEKGPDGDEAYPRTAVATDASGQTLWLIVADGRQPGYSEGATLADLIAIVRGLGATDALNLDGGGSTTLALARDRVIGPPVRVLNSPIHTYIPGRERPVANHLGIYARNSQP